MAASFHELRLFIVLIGTNLFVEFQLLNQPLDLFHAGTGLFPASVA